MQRRRGRRPAAPRSKAGKLAVFAVALAATGYLCARFIALLADVRPYMGWYWPLAVVAGIGIAVGLPWGLFWGTRNLAGWLRWALAGYPVALVVGMRYYASLKFTPQESGPARPPAWFVLEIAGLSAVTLTFVAITLLLLLAAAEVIAPRSVGGRIRARRAHRAGAAPHPRPADERMTARLRRQAPGGGPHGRWVRGAIRVRPGSMLWEPARGGQAVTTELVAATIVPEAAGRHARGRRAVTLDTPAGRVQLDCPAEILTLLQAIATGQADGSA